MTDNGSNFTKAFREFRIVMNQHSGDVMTMTEKTADVTFESVDQILNEDTRDTAPAIILPPHHPIHGVQSQYQQDGSLCDRQWE